MAVTETELETLIKEGETFDFSNNSERKEHGIYSRASDDLLGWTANVEEFIRVNYGNDSGPYKLYESFDRNRLTGYYESDYREQLKILLGALKACRQITPNTKKRGKDDHPITSLLKNIYFWTAIVIISGGAFSLGLYFGSSKFDKEKSDYYDENKKLREDAKMDQQTIAYQDSVIYELHNKIINLEQNQKGKK